MLSDLPDPSGSLAPDECLQRIKSVNQAYLGLERHSTEAEATLQQKLTTAFWRTRFLNRIMERVADWSQEDQQALVEILTELRIYIPEPLQARLSRTLRDRQLFALLMAQQGIRLDDATQHSAQAGPGIDLKIKVNRSSDWPFVKWKQIPEFSQYPFEEDGVHYRGVFFRSGDIFLSNVNLDGNAVYTALSNPKSYCSHAAVFAILQDGSRRFPAVVETYERGVRAVPLNVFVGPRYVSYTEIYRHQGLRSEHRERINSAAIELIENVKGYNFDTEDSDRHYMSCTGVARFLYQDAGLERIAAKSQLAERRICSNLHKLGYTFFDPFFAPVDYLLNENFSAIGWIDNNQFDKLLTRELIESRFRDMFSQREIKLNKFPAMHRINEWGIGHIRRQTALGRIISRVEGFDHISLPKGPDKLMAVITLVEAQIGKAIRKTHPFVKTYLAGQQGLDLQSVMADESVQKTLARNLKLPWLQ